MFTATRNNETRKLDTIEEARRFYRRMADRSQLWTITNEAGKVVIQ